MELNRWKSVFNIVFKVPLVSTHVTRFIPVGLEVYSILQLLSLQLWHEPSTVYRKHYSNDRLLIITNFIDITLNMFMSELYMYLLSI